MDEDPVVAEADVLLCKSLVEQLYLLQYPLRASTDYRPEHEPLSAKVKPKQHKVELELGIDSRSSNYCHSKGEQFALNVDSDADPDQRFFAGMVMDKQTYSSVEPDHEVGSYVAGFWKHGALHLCPLSALVQMRPNFNYLDKADKVAARRARELALEAGDSSQDDSAAEEEAKAVTVKFQRVESDEARARRLASYDYLHKQQQREPWLPCRYFSAQSASAIHLREQLLSAPTDDTLEFSMGFKDYLERLIPPPSAPQDSASSTAAGVMNKTQLRALPLKEQVRSLLLSAKLLRHSQLLELLPGTPESAQVLKLVQQLAHLVLGCWVVQSEVLYPAKFRSSHSEAPAEALQKARDYMLSRFVEHHIVSRREIAAVTKLPADDITQMLEEVARLRVNQGWEFLLDQDREFLSKYPEVAQRQAMLWESRSAALIKHYKVSAPLSPRKAGDPFFPPRRRRTSSRTRASESLDDTAASPRRRRRSSGRERRLTGESSASAAEVVHSVSQCLKASSADGPTPMETDHGDTPTNEGPDSRLNGAAHSVVKEEIDESLSQLQRELRSVVLSRLRSRYIVSRGELSSLLLVYLAKCEPGSALAAGVSDQDFREAAAAVGGREASAHWVKEYKAQPVFVFVPDDDLKPLRELLLSQFEKKPSYAQGWAWLQKNAEEAGHSYSKEQCLSVLQDYCDKQSHKVYYLRGVALDS